MHPRFYIEVMLSCVNYEPVGVRGPGALASLPHNLEGVSYSYSLEPTSEPPFLIDQLCIYMRICRTNNAEGRRKIGFRLFHVEDPNNEVEVPYPPIVDDEGNVSLPQLASGNPFNQAEIFFPQHSPIVSVPMRFGNLLLPRLGRYRLELYVKRIKTNWKGEWAFKAHHHFAIAMRGQR